MLSFDQIFHFSVITFDFFFISVNVFELEWIRIVRLLYHDLFHHTFLSICTPGNMFVSWYAIYSISLASLFRVYDTTEIAFGNLIAGI